MLRGRVKVLAVKENIDLCPWADVVYGCDPAWWKHRRGLPDFEGLKVCWKGARLDYPDVHGVEISSIHGKDKYSDDFALQGPIGGGGNSGFQALNLAVQWGARLILLVGFDMTDRGGVHWYGRNYWRGSNNPGDANFRKWITAFDGAAPRIAAAGITVMNASPSSALQCFPKVTVDEFVGRVHRLRSSRSRGLCGRAHEHPLEGVGASADLRARAV